MNADPDSTQIWDVVVVGSGMGGSMAAAVLADSGLSVLVIESGTKNPKGRNRSSFAAKLKHKIFAEVQTDLDSERWPDPLLFRTTSSRRYNAIRPILGRVAGGSAAIYGAALGRARRSDFEQDWQPSAWLAGAASALPNNWPLNFDEMVARYGEVEKLLRVTGSPDPLDRDDNSDLRAAPPISSNSAALFERLRSNGRHPFRMHVAIDYRPGCNECQGELCHRQCKSTSFNRLLDPRIAGGKVALRMETHAERIERDPGDILRVRIRDNTGNKSAVSARRIVLAGGALNTPLLLRRSASLWANDKVPEQVGAGLMFHFSDMLAVMEANDGPGNGGPLKTLAFRDHYVEGNMPLAECQSLGLAASPWMVGDYLEGEMLELGLGRIPLLSFAANIAGRIAAKGFSNAYLFTAALEDLPYLHNRVDPLGPSIVPGLDRIAVTYKAPEELLVRARRLRALLREAFAPAQVRFLKRLGAPNLGHPMGTCRMGDDPAVSVVDPDGQVWGQPGIYVADASAFPSSLGINPALTVAANALRVAENIVGQTVFNAEAAAQIAVPAFDTH